MAIISFKHGFIFIKTTKTAGTSIEVDLSAVAGKDAVVTSIIPAEEGHQPRNFADPSGKVLFVNHMKAGRIRALLGRERYQAMVSFCVEREPVAKCVSHFHMLRNSPLHNKDGAYALSWPEFVERGDFPIDLAKYTEIVDGRRRRMVNRILRYDALPGALTRLMEERGVPGFRLSTRAKSDYSRNRLIAADQVSAAERARIYDAFRETLEIPGIDWSRPAGDGD